jgi:predicted porin
LVAAGLLAGGLSTTSASAADLGGNCCADLEERIAELEATVARKGNRKVSLTISGWVAEQVMFWDDGTERNVYIGGVGGTLASHFKFSGEAQIRQGLTAGYLLQIEALTSSPLGGQNQNQDDHTGSNSLGVLQSYWYLKDDRLGKISIGQLSPASDNTAILTDGSGSLVPANWVLFDNIAFLLRRNGAFTGGTWGSLAACQSANNAGVAGDCGGFAVPGNYIRYDSPTFAGFSFSADWGEDDAWDVAARYAGEFNGIKVALAASYFEQNDSNPANAAGIASSYWQIGGYVQHVPTGLFMHAAYGSDDTDRVGVVTGDTWYLKAGIRQRWTSLGHTVLYGEYGKRDDHLSTALDPLATGSELTQWGLGLVQEVDAAAMSLWLSYRHYEGEVTCSGGGNAVCAQVGTNSFDDFHIVKFGALINF